MVAMVNHFQVCIREGFSGLFEVFCGDFVIAAGSKYQYRLIEAVKPFIGVVFAG